MDTANKLLKPVGNLLDSIFTELKDVGVNFDRMSPSDLELAKQICNQKDVIMWLQDFENLVPVCINDKGKEYYGFDSNSFGELGFEVYPNIAHPDDFAAVHALISYFQGQPKGTCRTVCRVKHFSGEYRWIYALDRALSYTELGLPKYLISITYDIEDLINRHTQDKRNDRIEYEERNRYNSLTPREQEILKLIGQEMNSQEIANKLFVEVSTISTHRKHLLRKLEVRSSVGLARYAPSFW